MNKAMLTGRLTAAPELRSTNGGKSVCDFTLAVDRRSAEKAATDFIDCTAFGKQAENLARYKGKGDEITVVGELRVDKYKDKDGHNHTYAHVVALEIEYLRSARRETRETPDASQDKVVVDEPSDYPLDLPF